MLETLRRADPKLLAQWSAYLVIAAVFLMGTHSAFFVPAKYGVMPEILHSSVLSGGNGLLEGTSFVAQILGIEIEPFGPKAHERRAGCRRGPGGGPGGRHRSLHGGWRLHGAPSEYGAHAGQKLA